MFLLNPNLGQLQINQLSAFNHRILFLILMVEVSVEVREDEVGAEVELDAEVKTMEEVNLIFVIS